MSTNEQPLLPFETQVQEGAVRARRRARAYALGLRLRWAYARKREAAKLARARANTLGLRLRRAMARRRHAAMLARARLRRAGLELRATARNSATVAGVSRDLDRIGKAVTHVAPAEATASGRLRRALARLKVRAKGAGARSRAFALRSSTVNGLAIDTKRVARRVRAAREGRHLRPAR